MAGRAIDHGVALGERDSQLTATPPGGEPVRRHGYTLTLYRKGADGRWRLARYANLLTVQS